MPKHVGFLRFNIVGLINTSVTCSSDARSTILEVYTYDKALVTKGAVEEHFKLS